MENGRRAQEPARRRKKSVLRRILGVFRAIFITLWTILLIGVLSAGVGLYYFKQYVEVTLAPSLQIRAEDYTMNQSSFVYYQDKETGDWKELQNVHGEENRVLVDFDQMSDYLWQAAVAIEDQRFFQHEGVDWRRTAKAVMKILQGDSSMGGSTITQQVLKNMTEDDKPYINRKIREIFRALEFEKNYKKEQILELYLNTIYLGKSCYGVQTAAQYYFGKDAKDLDLAESACLIAITNNPSLFGPMYDITYTRKDGSTVTPRELNKQRQIAILDKMCDPEVINPITGKPYITEAEAEAAKAEVLQFSDGSTSADEIVEKATGEIEINSWFVDRLIQEVAADLAEKNGIETKEAMKLIYNSGYKIYTTLDPEIQAIAESVYEDRSNLDVTSRSGQKLQSGITIIDPYTGDIVAMVGKVGEKDRNQGWNYAVGKRQVGSSMKPLTAYAPALDAGTITPGTAFDNYPVRMLNGAPWPKNSPNTYTGFTSVRYGIQQSINTIAVQALESVGVEEAFRFATENLCLSLEPEDMAEGALGMGGLTRGLNTVEMAAAYACFANGGIYYQPRMYKRVTRIDATGQEITVLEHEGESHMATKETTAYLMTDMLKNAVDHGTGGSAKFSGMTIAGKTGTTNKNYDRYFVGYTPYYVAAVWTGYDTPEKISYSGNPAITMWKKVMQQVHADLPNKDFDLSSAGLEKVNLCADSGKLLTSACSADLRGGRGVSYLIPSGSKPTESCPYHTMVNYCTEGHCMASEDCPAESVTQIGALDYTRENYGIGLPADNAYTVNGLHYSLTAVREDGTTGCPAHNGMKPTEELPGDPSDPNDPNYNPDLPYDPNDPFIPIQPEPSDPMGGTTAPTPDPTPTPTPIPEPEEPSEPAEPTTPPSTTGGNWFDDLWANP